jgi:hypothetical protein
MSSTNGVGATTEGLHRMTWTIQLHLRGATHPHRVTTSGCLPLMTYQYDRTL